MKHPMMDPKRRALAGIMQDSRGASLGIKPPPPPGPPPQDGGMRVGPGGPAAQQGDAYADEIRRMLEGAGLGQAGGEAFARDQNLAVPELGGFDGPQAYPDQFAADRGPEYDPDNPDAPYPRSR